MSDNKKEIICPACGCEMVKIFDKENGINIDICINGCGGIFFDNRELEKFDELHENAETIFNTIKGKTFKKVDEDTRICPICNIPMVKQGARGNNDIVIDVCNSCGAKFLDNGELQRVRTEAVTDASSLNNMIISLYQKNLEQASSNNHNTNARRKFFQNFMNQFLD